MARMSLAPGIRFHPTDDELIVHFLKRKVTGKKLRFECISELNLYNFSPWDLPEKSCLKTKDLQWYFFCPRERKYGSSSVRLNRATQTGFWKSTGKDRTIYNRDRVVGKKKTLVFYERGAAPGKKTNWVVHEYRLDDNSLADAGVVQDSFVICKVFQKSGSGPKNGAQYGAPFIEEEWDDDGSVMPTLSSDGLLPLVHALPEIQNCSVVTSMAAVGEGCRPLLDEIARSKVQSSGNNVHPNGQNYSMVTNLVDPGSASGWCLTDGGLNSVGPSVNVESMDEDCRPLPDETGQSKVQSSNNNVRPNGQNYSVVTNMVGPGSMSGWCLTDGGLNSVGPSVNDDSMDEDCRPLPDETGQSKVQSSNNNVHPNGQNYSMVTNMGDPGSISGWCLTDGGLNSVGPSVNDESMDEEDDIAHLLSALSEALLPHENCNTQTVGNLGSGGNTEPTGSYSFNDLEDLCNLGDRIDAPASHLGCNQSNLLLADYMPFLELQDLDAALDGPYAPSTPFGLEQNAFFTGLLNSDHACDQTGPSSNGPSFGPQPNFLGSSEFPVPCNLGDRIDAPASHLGCNQSNLLLPDDMSFLELQDLDAAPDGPYAASTPFGQEQGFNTVNHFYSATHRHLGDNG